MTRQPSILMTTNGCVSIVDWNIEKVPIYTQSQWHGQYLRTRDTFVKLELTCSKYSFVFLKKKANSLPKPIQIVQLFSIWCISTRFAVAGIGYVSEETWQRSPHGQLVLALQRALVRAHARSLCCSLPYLIPIKVSDGWFIRYNCASRAHIWMSWTAIESIWAAWGFGIWSDSH